MTTRPAPPRLCRDAGANPALWREPAPSGGLLPRRQRPPRRGQAKQLQGKELSYNNINDTDAAFELVSEFLPADGPACAIIKHANPCGVARGATLAEAYSRAHDCDRTSAFGGIIALNTRLDLDTAKAITGIFTEVVIAPGADDDAIAHFATKKNLRLLTTKGLANPAAAGLAFKQVSGGFLVQDRDNGMIGPDDLRVVTKRAPSTRNWPICCSRGRSPSM